MAVCGIIPARLHSSRLPRKLLLCETGKPLIQHTWEAASEATSLSELIIATDSEEIAEVGRSFGARCEMTGEHPSGTDRIAEVIRHLPDAKIIVNIQGDEPEIRPDSIDRVVQLLLEHPTVEMATLATPIVQATVLNDPSAVKVVRARDGRALYFSRHPIPFCRDHAVEELLRTDSPWLLHIGLYAYRRNFLPTFCSTHASALEKLERLEQLRALEVGASIQVAVVHDSAVGIDTKEDYRRFVSRYRGED